MKPLTKPSSTLKELAKATKLSLSAVSYALRGAPNIPPATAERVRAAAAKLNYRANPRVGELMAHIRRGRSVARGERIAFIWSDAPWQKRHFASFFQGACARAETLGYGIEEFWLREPGMTGRRLAGILKTRGITGILFSPLHRGNELHLDWDWEPFCPVILGNAASTPELHRAGHHHFLGMRLAMEKLIEKGHRRIAAVIDPAINERAKRAWSASFLEHHPLRGRSRPFLLLAETMTRQNIRFHLQKNRADALVTLTSSALLLGKADSSPLAIAVLDRGANENTWSGIDQSEETIATQAVDLVAGQLYNNERGVPKDPKMLLFPGRWID